MWHDASVSVDQSIRERDGTTGLNDELHDLHASLSGAVTEFEALLDETLDALPDWVEADRVAIRDLFNIDLAGDRVTMGPRAATLVASRVEIFVRSSIATRADGYDATAIAKWVSDRDELETVITAVEQGGQDASETAIAQLSATLEELITELAEQERDDPSPGDQLDALKKKLRSGKVGAALAKRESEADTLEVQRQKTEELEEAWLPLSELAEAGAALSTDVAERLRSVLNSGVREAAKTHPEIAEAAGIEVAELAEESDPVPEPPTEVERITRADGSDALEEPRFRYDTDAPRTAQDTPSVKAHTATATMEVSISVEEFREPAFRIRTAWRRVEIGEVLLALGAPTAYFVGITALTIGYHVGLWAENPFVEWPSAFPMFFAFALWAILYPIWMGWQVQWEGRIPHALRMRSKREQSFVDVDEVALTIADHCFDLADCTATLCRYKEGSERGWTLRLDDGDEEVLFASEAASGRWEDSNSELFETEPQGAWRIGEEALLQIADRTTL